MQNLKEIIQTLGGDPYQILQTSPDAEPQLLRKNYRTLAAKYHPDKNKQENAKTMFIKINQAYEFLQSQDNRFLYKNQIKAVEQQRKKMESMDAERRKMAEDLKRRQEEHQQREKDMERELKRRKQFYRKKMEEEQEKQRLRNEISSGMGSEKYYELVETCDIKWEEGFSFTEKMLKIAFSAFGKVTNVEIESKRNKATVRFSSIEECARAVSEFKHPMISIDFHLEKKKRDKLLNALTIQKNTGIDLSLSSDNITRLKEIMNRNSNLYKRQFEID